MDHRLTGVDHLLVGVRDLESARAAWQRLGFTTTPRGRHVGWGTANYCIMFGSDYIELLGIVDPGQFTNGLDQFLAAREGGLGLALGSSDLQTTAAAWSQRGLEPSGPNPLSRLLELQSGPVEPRFRNVMLPARTTAGLNVFALEHLTPELLRRPEWVAHPNGALALVSCTVVAPDVAHLAHSMEQVFGPAALTRTDEVTAVHTGSAVILIASHEQARRLHPEFEIELPVDRPLIQVMAAMVASTDRLTIGLVRQGMPHQRGARGSVLVARELAAGIHLEFVQG